MLILKSKDFTRYQILVEDVCFFIVAMEFHIMTQHS